MVTSEKQKETKSGGSILVSNLRNGAIATVAVAGAVFGGLLLRSAYLRYEHKPPVNTEQHAVKAEDSACAKDKKAVRELNANAFVDFHITYNRILYRNKGKPSKDPTKDPELAGPHSQVNKDIKSLFEAIDKEDKDCKAEGIPIESENERRRLSVTEEKNALGSE